ncbi:MAG TPA: histidine phosphatase family protein [Acidimicrobiales bacterium]|nr:histidine phosphatase family protein [Acidimicrobiales bacterium]
MERAREVVLVRHGQTEWSANGRHTGQTDLPLTEVGEAQSRTVAPLLERWRFDLVLTSPLERARATCRIAGLEAQAEVDPDLVEWDYGEHEGRTTPEIREDDPGWTVWRGPIPGGETVDQVGERADRLIARLARVDGDVALFSHGHLLRVLTARWLGLDPRAGAALVLDTGTLSVLGTERETRAIRLWNGLPA